MAPNSSDHQLTNHLSWRAGCGENRTSGSAGGLGKRTQEQSRHRAPSRPNWRHRGYEWCVTVLIDLTPVRDGTGPARLVDMIEGRSKAAFKAWLAARPKSWRGRVEVVAMDGFTGYKTAANEELPQAVTVMDPFHVVSLAGDALDETRREVQQATTGRRGTAKDLLYRARRTLLTGLDLITVRQAERLDALFTDERNTPVEVAWSVYQKMISAYRHADPAQGKHLMSRLIGSITAGVPAGIEEVARLGRTLNRRKDDVLAYFDHPGSSNGPTEAICESGGGWSGIGWSGWMSVASTRV